MGAVSRSCRSGRPARGAEHHSGARPRARPTWADVGLAVHVLSGRREDHGRGSRGHPDRRVGRPAVRRRAPLELRCVCLSRANAAVRPERLRRDAPRSVRVRREADGSELHDRGAQQQLRRVRCPCRHMHIDHGLSNTDGGVRRDAHHGRLVRPLVGTRAHERGQGRCERLGTSRQQEGSQIRAEARREAVTKSALPAQLAGALEADRAGRRPLPDRQPATGADPATGPGPADRPVRRRAGTRDPRAVPRLSNDVAGRPPSPPREIRDRRHGPQGGGRRQRRDACVRRACCRVGTRTTRCSSRSRRRARRSSKITCRRADTGMPASEWSRARD